MNDLRNDIKMVLDITSRVDERVKSIHIGQAEMNIRINKIVDDLSNVSSRVAALEASFAGKEKVEDVVKDIQLKMELLNSAKLIEEMEVVGEKINLLDRRLIKLEDHQSNWMSKVKQYTGLFMQGVWVIIVCYLLYKLGLQTPNVP